MERKHFLFAIILLAIVPVAVVVYVHLPKAWQSHWGLFGSPIIILGYHRLIAWMSKEDRRSRQQILKDSVNPTYPHPGR